MRSVRYGSKVINYTIQPAEGLKSHYISVERHAGVVLKGKSVVPAQADKMILKKASWILKKLELVQSPKEGEIVTGSRITYLGKTYYVQVRIEPEQNEVKVTFNYSKFLITLPSSSISQQEILNALQQFYKRKALEKIEPRVEKLSHRTGLRYQKLQFRHMKRRWGSCTGKNKIIINTDAIKLSFSLIDYIIIHELVHTKVKDHSKRYWSLLSKHEPKWKKLEELLKEDKK